MKQMSKAIVMTETGGPEVLRLCEVDMPAVGDDEVCVKVHSIGVNPVETYWRSGTAGRNPKLPYTPGKDCAGVVHSVGKNVGSLKPGDRVFTSGVARPGSYSHHCAVKASDAHILPPNVSFDAGASLGTPGLTAYRALVTRGEAQPGDKLFIHGASGGVGLIAIQLARSMGLTVVATAGQKAGVELVKSVGAHHGLNHNSNGYFKEVEALGPYNVVIEVLANVNLDKDLAVAAKKGRVVIVGSRGTVSINPRDIMTKELDIRGVFLTAQTEAQKKEAVACLTQALADGSLKPVISEVLSLEDAPLAHAHVIKPANGTQGKLVMRPKL
ncbi:Quinone oxidoreductase 1 [Diplonema papillatum]|nr:Quinone oxidoreductase 1 [Diplonema papillatum]